MPCPPNEPPLEVLVADGEALAFRLLAVLPAVRQAPVCLVPPGVPGDKPTSFRFRALLAREGWSTFAAALHAGAWVARAVRGGRAVEGTGPTCRQAWENAYREATSLPG
jgi:hypothetical protein